MHKKLAKLIHVVFELGMPADRLTVILYPNIVIHKAPHTSQLLQYIVKHQIINYTTDGIAPKYTLNTKYNVNVISLDFLHQLLTKYQELFFNTVYNFHDISVPCYSAGVTPVWMSTQNKVSTENIK